jgi:integrase
MAKVRRRTWKNKLGEAKAAWLVDYTDSRGDRRRKHFLSKKAADVFRVHVEGQMQAGTYRSDADKVTVKEVCDSFLEHCSGRHDRDERMTRKMLVVYKGHVNNHILNADYGLGSRRTVQTFAGHASLQITMDRYGHLFPSEDHKKAMDQIARGLFA